MIRWILIILGIIVLIFLIVIAGQRFLGSNDETPVADNNTPIVISDSVSGTEGQPITGNVLANDTDDGIILVVNTTPVSNPTHGNLTLNPDGTFTYIPTAGYKGTDSFKYSACDPSGNCAEGTVQITINSAADSANNASGEAVDDGGQGGVEETPSEDAVVEGNAGATESTDANSPEGDNNNAPAEENANDDSINEAAESSDDANASNETTDSANNANETNTTDQNQGQGAVTHTVKQGEWLIQIGRCYGTDPVKIRMDNQLPYPSWIMANDEWVITDVGSVSTPFNEPCIMFYTVQQGDTLYSIAQTYHLELDMLMKANFGCYGYGYYHPPVPTPYEGDEVEAHHHGDGWYTHPWYGYGPGYGAHSPYVYNGCYFPSAYNPTIYIGQELVIPVNLENADMRP